MYNPESAFSHDLYIMPFDHRGSFQEKLLGIRGREPNAAEAAQITRFKEVIFDGFRKAVAAGIPREKTGILVDEQYGSRILEQARGEGFMTAVTVEKSGQDEFDFEYGNDFGAHLLRFRPTFAKVLVRYNPEGDAGVNRRQRERLKLLSDFCHGNRIRLMLELLAIATPAQLGKAGGDVSRFDRELRPALVLRAMREIQEAAIEADLWKLEGLETHADCEQVARQARAGGRDAVGVIVLGRGENEAKVRHWIRIGAEVPGVIGFAVGRTIFWEPLKSLRDGKCSAQDASARIGANYKAFCELFESARKRTA